MNIMMVCVCYIIYIIAVAIKVKQAERQLQALGNSLKLESLHLLSRTGLWLSSVKSFSLYLHEL